MGITQMTDKALARPLKVLAPLIQKDFETGEKLSMNYYISAGEKLNEARLNFEDDQRGSARFWRWVDEQDFPIGQSQARRYMKVAADVPKGLPRRERAFPSIRQAIGDTHYPPKTQASWAAEVRDYVQDRVEPQRYAESSRVKEDTQIRELGMQLIDIGFKVLAAQLHPDKSGGSHEAMQRLNEVRRILRGALP